MRAKLRTVASSVLLAAVLAACGSNVRLDPPTIPTPLIEKLPVTVGLRMPPEFDHFVHEEEVLGREQWTIDLGSSNAALFRQLFQHMFESVVLLDADDDASQHALDALVEPSIDAFEFSVPNQTKTEAFAVWIRYRLKIFDSAGVQVANWPVSAYGKAQTTTMGGSDALRHAAVLAMRDAAALMIMKLDQETRISSLKADSAAPSPAAGGDDDDVQTSALGGSKDDPT